MTTAVIELLRLSLHVYFSIARMHNATKEQLDSIYQEEKDRYLLNDPKKLENV